MGLFLFGLLFCSFLPEVEFDFIRFELFIYLFTWVVGIKLGALAHWEVLCRQAAL